MISMEREVVADDFKGREGFEAQCGNEGEFHVKDTVLVIGSEDEVAVGITDRFAQSRKTACAQSRKQFL